MSGIGPEEISNVYNLVISTDSAQNLVNALNKKDFWEILTICVSAVAAISSAVAAYFSAKSANKSAQISHDLFINEINKQYFNIRQKLPETLQKFTEKNKLIMCNFLEMVCSYYFYKKINEKELLVFRSDLNAKTLIEFSKKSNALGNYKKWLRKNNFIS